MSKRTANEGLRSLAFGSISGTFADIGTPTTHACYQVTVQNTTDQTIIVSKDDGATEWQAIPMTTSAIFDFNHKTENDQNVLVPVGTQFQVKDAGVATTEGSVYISTEYVV